VSSLGYERLSNWAFQIAGEDAFVEAVLAGQPEPPRYFAEMKRVNKVGPEILGGERQPARLGGEGIEKALAEGRTIADIRHSGDYAAEHVPGTLNLPAGKLFATWAGWLMPYDRPFYLMSDSEAAVREAVRDLSLIGLDQAVGWFGPDALRAHAEAGGETAFIRSISVDEMCDARLMEDADLLDVRGATEWEAGHVPGSLHMPLGYLASRSLSLAKTKPVIVQCGKGTRSPIAASVLEGLGFTDVRNLAGGFEQYLREGLPVERS
jgi:hydroxyacylglutathione hydrolase